MLTRSLSIQSTLTEKSLFFSFFIGLIGLLVLPILAPSLRLFTFIPFLVFVIYQKNRIHALWTAFFCGLLLDLFTAEAHFGLLPLTYCLTLFLLYNQKRYFFADSLSTLPLMTFFFSALLTVNLTLIYSLLHGQVPSFNILWVISDGLLYPMLDAGMSFLIFILPAILLGQKPRKGSDYFT